MNKRRLAHWLQAIAMSSTLGLASCDRNSPEPASSAASGNETAQSSSQIAMVASATGAPRSSTSDFLGAMSSAEGTCEAASIRANSVGHDVASGDAEVAEYNSAIGAQRDACTSALDAAKALPIPAEFGGNLKAVSSDMRTGCLHYLSESQFVAQAIADRLNGRSGITVLPAYLKMQDSALDDLQKCAGKVMAVAEATDSTHKPS